MATFNEHGSTHECQVRNASNYVGVEGLLKKLNLLALLSTGEIEELDLTAKKRRYCVPCSKSLEGFDTCSAGRPMRIEIDRLSFLYERTVCSKT
jgi:hypothetical protein